MFAVFKGISLVRRYWGILPHSKRLPERPLQDPFYHKEKRRKNERACSRPMRGSIPPSTSSGTRSAAAIGRSRISSRISACAGVRRLLRRNHLGRRELSRHRPRAGRWRWPCRPSRRWRRASSTSPRTSRSPSSTATATRSAGAASAPTIPIPLDKLPDYFVKAAIATEDRRFYDHFGVDIIGTLRALVNNAHGDNGTQGGSSITQQLAKNLFLSPERTVERKIKEAFLAVWLEWHYSKDEILKLYFDRAYMGGGNFGVAAAAEYYFGKKITDVNLAEAAMLAGLFKAPTKYAPTVDLAAARARANLVLSNLVDAGYMTEGQVAGGAAQPGDPDRSLRRAQLAQLLPRLGLRPDPARSSRRPRPAPTPSSCAPPSIRCCNPMPRTRSPR